MRNTILLATYLSALTALAATTPPAPTITAGGVVPVYSHASTIMPGEWISIFGTNLAASTASWNGDFPTSLNGTSVNIDGKPAYIWFVSATQLNVQAPNDAATGSVPVVVTTGGGTAKSTVTLAAYAPSFSLLDTKHVTGIILRSDGSGAYGGGSYDIIGPTGTSLGYPTVAARPGENIELFAVGLGPTNPAVMPGQNFQGAAPVTGSVTVRINGLSVTPAFAGLSSAGLYQINLTVPANPGTGDVSLSATVGGATTQTGAVISLQAPIPLPQLQNLTLSTSTASGGTAFTGTVALSTIAPAGGVVVSLSSGSSLVTLPATVMVAAGASSASFTASVGAVNSSGTVSLTASYNGTSRQAGLTITPPANPNCASVAGNWNATESGTANYYVSAEGQSESLPEPIYGSGTVTIGQSGCSIQYDPTAESSLIGSGLTQAQLSSLTRTGTVSGNSVSVTGALALVNTVAAVASGLSITNISTNTVTATGQVSGTTMTLNETGSFAASGTFSIDGENGSFTLTISSSSVASFSWATASRPSYRPPATAAVLIVGGDARNDISSRVSAALRNAIVFGSK